MPSDILMAILPQPVWLNRDIDPYDMNAHRPYYNYYNSFSFQNATLSTVTISDNDNQFSYLSPADQGLRPDMQILIEDTSFGGRIMPKGTQLSSVPGSYITDSQGNEFAIFFPGYYSPKDWYTKEIVPDRTALFIFPVSVKTPDGQIVTPRFNPAETFRFSSAYAPQMGEGFDYFPADPPCFTRGTWIEAEGGKRLVETLAVGDLVLTRDHGLQPIRWIGQTYVSAGRLDLQPNLLPVRISAGALGAQLPSSDLTVSPQHRILINSATSRRFSGSKEVLVPAKHLRGVDGIEVLHPAEGVTYLHLLLDRHEILLSNGAWTESLFLGPQAIGGMDAAARREIFSLFPELRSRDQHQPVASRPLLDDHKGHELADRHVKSGRKLACVH